MQAAVLFAGHCGYKATARSGGHSYAGSSSCNSLEGKCIQIDVGHINHMEVSFLPSGDKQVKIGPGIKLGEALEGMIANDIYMPVGECSTVGAGGHMQTGGESIVDWSEEC